jgi:hypothetical protein
MTRQSNHLTPDHLFAQLDAHNPIEGFPGSRGSVTPRQEARAPRWAWDILSCDLDSVYRPYASHPLWSAHRTPKARERRNMPELANTVRSPFGKR